MAKTRSCVQRGLYSSYLQVNEQGGGAIVQSELRVYEQYLAPRLHRLCLAATQQGDEDQLGLTTAVPLVSSRASPCLTEC